MLPLGELVENAEKVDACKEVPPTIFLVVARFLESGNGGCYDDDNGDVDDATSAIWQQTMSSVEENASDHVDEGD